MPDVRSRLLEAAAQLLNEEGPAALTARRLAAEAGTSTMAVYTHFGGMPALVRAVAAEGFAQLYARVDAVEDSDDPLEGLRRMAVAYREHARAHPHMYAVMFGSASLGGYRLAKDERDVGRPAFEQLASAVERAMAAGALRQDEPRAVAGQLWCALHGYVVLELSGFHEVVDDPEGQLLWPMLANLLRSLAA